MAAPCEGGQRLGRATDRSPCGVDGGSRSGGSGGNELFVSENPSGNESNEQGNDAEYFESIAFACFLDVTLGSIMIHAFLQLHRVKRANVM